MAEDEAQEPLLKRMAKNAIRTVLPYSAEEMEQTGRVTNTGGFGRDVVNLGTTLSPAKIPAMIAGGAVRTATDIGAQLDNDGELDAERTAWTAGLNVGLPAGVGAAKKPIAKAGGFLKDRASRQLYGSLVPKELHSKGKNPITPQKLEQEFLAKDNIPIITTEAKALERMRDINLDNLGRKSDFREQLARSVDGEIPLFNQVKPDQAVSRGAYEDARRRIAVDFKNDRVAGQKVIDNLDEWAQAQGIGSTKGTKNAYNASKLVTDLNKFAKTFAKTPGATSPYELSRSYMAQALNKQIEKISPELREATRDMAVNMAIIDPINNRLAKATTQQPKSGFFAGLTEPIAELSTTLHRRPQGAQLKYNMGRAFIEGSPILKDAYKYGAYTLPSQMEDE
jgi:hypothetical protein